MTPSQAKSRKGPTTRLILKRRAEVHAKLRAEVAQKSAQPVQEPNEELQRYLDALRMDEAVAGVLGENLGRAA